MREDLFLRTSEQTNSKFIRIRARNGNQFQILVV